VENFPSQEPLGNFHGEILEIPRRQCKFLEHLGANGIFVEERLPKHTKELPPCLFFSCFFKQEKLNIFSSNVFENTKWTSIKPREAMNGCKRSKKSRENFHTKKFQKCVENSCNFKKWM